MAKNYLDALIVSSVQASILAYFSRPGAIGSIRGVAKELGYDVGNTHKMFIRLEKLGIIEFAYQDKGRHYYRANKKCPIMGALRQLSEPVGIEVKRQVLSTPHASV